MKWIVEHRNQFRISRMTQLLEVSQSGYYSYSKRPPSKRSRENEFLLTKVREAYEKGRKFYGSPRITASLRKEGYRVGHNRVSRLMRENQISAVKKRKWVQTTDSNHSRPVAENILNREFEVNQANQVWAGDITYVATCEGWIYLAVVLDLYSRKVIGWSMSKSMTTQLVTDALTMAIQRRTVLPGLLFHSDRGSQYASHEFQWLLKSQNIIKSMSRKGNCWDNACSESFFGSLKTEGCGRVFTSRKEASSVIFDYVEVFYNRQRLHSTLGYVSPEQFESQNVA